MRTFAERDADPGSVAVRANAEEENESTQVQSKNLALSPREGEYSHAIGTLTISAVKANGFKDGLKCIWQFDSHLSLYHICL